MFLPRQGQTTRCLHCTDSSVATSCCRGSVQDYLCQSALKASQQAFAPMLLSQDASGLPQPPFLFLNQGLCIQGARLSQPEGAGEKQESLHKQSHSVLKGQFLEFIL